MKVIKKIGKILGIFTAAILIIVCVLTGMTALQNHTEGEETAEGSESWMAQLSDETSLADIALPGTHDSATQYVQLSFFSKCQGTGIADQLDSGFRYLDIRLGEEVSDDGETSLKLMHGFTTCRRGILPWSSPLYLMYVLKDCYEFLEENPTETIVFNVKYEHGDLETAEFQELLYAEILENEDMWYLGSEVPALGDVRGKIVLARRYEDEAGLGEDAGLQLAWTDQPGSADTYLSIEANENPACTLIVQDRYEYGSDDKWNAFLAGIEGEYADNVTSDADHQININFLSTKGTLAYGHPYHYAKDLNERLLAYEETENTFYGWTIVDFGNAGIAQKIYSTNFD